MANEKRLIDANALITAIQGTASEVARNAPYDPEWFTRLAARQFEILCIIDEQPTVDEVPVDDMREFAADVAYQFGYYCNTGGRLCLSHGGLSTLEWAFDILGWENLHPVPECECEIDGCHEHATCGVQTKDGYKRMCDNHCRERKDNG